MPAVDTDAYVSALADDDGAIRELLNPVTRTPVILQPPFTPQSADHEVGFIKLFAGYCRAAWEVGRLDPDTLALHSGKSAIPMDQPTSFWPGASSEA
jgi:hypothetical protein